jgi:DNA-binding response OmpR family regulator
MATILIAEDNEMLRDPVKTMLSEKGHEVIATEDGLEALDALRSAASDHSISLLITDIILPKVDGMSLITEARKLDRRIKILAITGGGRQIHSNFIKAAMNCGAHDALKKPFTQQQLMEKVDHLLLYDSLTRPKSS